LVPIKENTRKPIYWLYKKHIYVRFCIGLIFFWRPKFDQIFKIMETNLTSVKKFLQQLLRHSWTCISWKFKPLGNLGVFCRTVNFCTYKALTLTVGCLSAEVLLKFQLFMSCHFKCASGFSSGGERVWNEHLGWGQGKAHHGPAKAQARKQFLVEHLGKSSWAFWMAFEERFGQPT
jgi:hypothetical protein